MADVGNFEVEDMADHAKKPVGYHIVDRHTKSKVGYAATLQGARRSVDRRDNAYGAYRYTHQPDYGNGD